MKILVALLDVKTETFLAPMAVVTRGEAERVYVEILRSAETIVGKHPNDFPLYEIGTYDERTGQVSPLMAEGNGFAVPPRMLCDAATVQQLRKEG